MRMLYDFIFRPGFSTAGEVSQLAGRGVGMDVVKTEVSELGGRIEILSQSGHGTTFRLYLPLTLAVTQTLVVACRLRNMYAVPSTMIEQVLELKEEPLAEVRRQGEVEWQGNALSFPLSAAPPRGRRCRSRSAAPILDPSAAFRLAAGCRSGRRAQGKPGSRGQEHRRPAVAGGGYRRGDGAGRRPSRSDPQSGGAGQPDAGGQHPEYGAGLSRAGRDGGRSAADGDGGRRFA
jgi:hypothetical protein